MTSLLDKENDPGKDLALLSSCDHLILSYGTYGMAAAWFNNNGLLFFFKIHTMVVKRPKQQKAAQYVGMGNVNHVLTLICLEQKKPGSFGTMYRVVF